MSKHIAQTYDLKLVVRGFFAGIALEIMVVVALSEIRTWNRTEKDSQQSAELALPDEQLES